MANHSATKKSIKQNTVKTARNKSKKSAIKTYIKKVITLAEQGMVEEAQKVFLITQSKLMKAANKNLYKKNTAARRVSMLAKKIKSAAEPKN